MATPIVLVTAVGAVSLAAPRRNEVLMTLIFPLAGRGARARRAAAIFSSATMVPAAGIFPAELTALRGAGLVAAVAIVAFAVLRRRTLRNVDVLILLAVGLGLAIVSGTELTDKLLSAFSFEKGNGGRILGLAVFAIFILFLLILRALSQAARNSRQLSAVLEGLAWEEFRQAKLPERFRGKIAILVPAYNEAENIGDVLDRMPSEVCGVETAVLVVDDGSRDGTGDVAAEHGATVARHVINRGGGAALRTGYRLMVESGAEIVVTLDADGQHLPSEMERLVKPVLDGEVDVAHGSRVLGEADRNHFARELGHRLLQPPRLLHHPHPRHRLLQRLPRRAHHGPAPARPAPGAVPHLRVHDRGDQARHPRQGGTGHRRAAPARPLEEAGRGPLRPRLRQRDRPDLAALISRTPGCRTCGRVGQVEVGAAAGADLDVELDRLAAGGALAFRFVLLAAVEDHRDQAERRQHGADQQPEPERAALGAADDRRWLVRRRRR